MFKKKIIIFRNILVLLSYISLASCDNPTGSKKELYIDAGEDQTTYVGSYAILDPSNSNVNETIDLIKWIQNESNPEKVSVYTQSILDEYQIVGFQSEGIYRFIMQISCSSGNIFTDSLKINVLPRQVGYITDPNLEIHIRYAMEYQVGDLLEDKLLELDSLTNANVGLKHKISELDGIEYCNNLSYLALNNANIVNLTPLENLTNLKYLDLGQNRVIYNIAPLSKLTELEWIDLSANLIVDLSPLCNLTELKYLDLRYNGDINDISAIKNMVELEELLFAQTSISDLSPLQNLTKIKRLWLSASSVTDISVISNLKNLVTLKISWSNVGDLSSLKSLNNLEWLALEQNDISDISSLQYPTNLKYVRLWDNQITNIKPLVDNPNIGKGDIVGLDDNPLDSVSINEYIPALLSRSAVVTW